jgi:cytochrome c oxidase assembly protein subunit 15
MATSWAAQRCLAGGEACSSVSLHRFGAMPAAGLVLLFVLVALLAGGWSRRQWPWLLSAVLLVVSQAVLGVTTLRLGLQQPLVTITHQLVAALLVGVLAALTVRSPDSSLPTRCSVVVDDTPLETCHG